MSSRCLRSLIVTFCLVTLAASGSAQRRSCSDSSVSQSAARVGAFRLNLVRPGIYQAVRRRAIAPDRAVVIVNDSDVVIVDATASAAAACALIADVRQLTPKPIRTVINTHFHFDHSDGNEVFPSNVEIIAHENARQPIASGESVSGRAVEFITSLINPLMMSLTRQADTAKNPARRDSLREQARGWQEDLAAIHRTVPTPPTRTVSHELTLVHSPREIRLLYVGRGHTAGDLVVFLPSDRIVITGDLLQTDVPYMGDGYFPEWISSLDSLKKLDFDIVIPGHQDSFSERERIDFLQDYLRDLWSQAGALHAAGVSAADAASRIDLRRHAPHLPSAARMGVSPFATRRAWEILDGTR